MTLEFELEAWTGQITGDTTSVGTLRGEDTFQSRRDQGVQWYAILPQRLSMSFATDIGVIRLGHQTYNWGLGLLVQDGRQPRDFGLAMRNNLVERIAFGTNLSIHSKRHHSGYETQPASSRRMSSFGMIMRLARRRHCGFRRSGVED